MRRKRRQEIRSDLSTCQKRFDGQVRRSRSISERRKLQPEWRYWTWSMEPVTANVDE